MEYLCSLLEKGVGERMLIALGEDRYETKSNIFEKQIRVQKKK